jgi:hypothetical protein
VGGLVIVGAMQIIAPLITVLALDTVSVMAAVLDPTARIRGTKNVLKVFFTPTLVMLQPLRSIWYWPSPHMGFDDGRDPDLASRLLDLRLDPPLWGCQALRGAAMR